MCEEVSKWWQKKEQIQTLRRRGLSYQEIRVQLPFPVAKGTVSRWCRDIELTPKQLDRLDKLKQWSWYRNRLKGSKAIQQQRAEEVKAIRARASREVPKPCRKALWMAGLMLYSAEGGKTDDLEFTNSDPHAVRFMMKWFREFCGVPGEKFKAYLNIHSGQNNEAIKRYWSDVTDIPVVQFGKSYIKKEGTGHRKNILYNGTIRISICNRDLFHKVQGWIEGFNQRIFGPLAYPVKQGTLNAERKVRVLHGPSS